MWQDCFKLLEDILNIAKQRQKTLKLNQRAVYYNYLAEVFWHAKYFNYHAFFFLQHYLVFKKNPYTNQEEQ